MEKCPTCLNNDPTVGMRLIFVWDDPNKGVAFNLYGCDYCGTIVKRDVWKNKGKVLIDIDNKVSHE